MKRYFVAQEDTNLYNVFDYMDFDSEGYYVNHEGEDGYHLDDFYIVAEFDTFEEACQYKEEREYYY